MSDQMKLFLQSYLEWADTDASGCFPVKYLPEDGLCANTHPWLQYAGFVEPALSNEYDVMREELRKLFVASDLDIGYPFDDYIFEMERRAYSHHRNPTRLEWIRQQLSEA